MDEFYNVTQQHKFYEDPALVGGKLTVNREIPSGGAFKILWDNNTTPYFSIVNGDITILQSGIYALQLSLVWQDNTVGNRFGYVTNDTLSNVICFDSRQVTSASFPGIPFCSVGTDVTYLAAGTVLSCFAGQDSSIPLNLVNITAGIVSYTTSLLIQKI